MGIRSRTIALVTATSLALFLAMGSVASLYATRTADETDTRDTIGVLDSSSAAIAAERKRLVTLCADWAPWDDSYAFVKRPTDEYVENNLPDGVMVNLGIDFMAFADASGRIVYAKALDPDTRQTANLPDGLARYLATQPGLLHISDPHEAVSGALSLPEGPFLIAAQPIGKSDYSAPPDGTLIVGFRVDEDALSVIRDLTRRPVAIYSSVSPTLPADARSAGASLGKPGASDVVVPGKTTIVAYRMIPGIEGQQGLVMAVTTPRTAYLESRSAIVGWGLAMTVFGIGIVGALALTLDRTVLRRLTGLSSAVADIERSTDAHSRLPVSGRDEISGLAVGINRMLEELDKTQSEMAYLVDHDPLTGLYNRRYFENELDREIEEHQRLGVQGAILWFDVDHFKEINDTLGHQTGDELLNAFGRHLLEETRAYCTVARLGGDEFGMLIPHVKGPDAVRAAGRLIAGISSRTFLAGDHDLRVSVSAGVVLYPEHGDKTTDLLARADIAMYDAKAKGGNLVVAYAPGEAGQSDMAARVDAADRILLAMREDRFVLYAQPILGSAGDAARCFELFLRMRDEHGELVFPADIIPTAERLGIIGEIDRWVARRAIRLLALAQADDPDVQFSINFSGAAFSDAALLDVIREEFEQTSASPKGLIIEITESTTIANIEAATTFIRAIREIGCRFSLDDFGSVASSYYYLKHLPVDFLKIDGSLVTGLATDSADANFVRTIVEMCRGLDIRTVAEYVENEQAMHAISATGVDFVQGYYVGVPEPLDVYLGQKFSEPARAWSHGEQDDTTGT